MDEGKIKEEKTAGLFKNIVRVLRDTWIWDKNLYGLTAAFMVATVVVGLVEVFLVKYLVDELTGANRLPVMLGMIAVATLTLLFSKVVISFVNSKHWYRLVMIRIHYMFERSKKLMEMPFEDSENPHILDMLEKSRRAVNSYISAYNAGAELFLKTLLLGFFSQIPLLISYFGILVGFDWLLLIFIAATVVGEYFLNVRLSKIQHKMWQENSPMERRMDYLRDTMIDAKWGKDIRVYRLAELLLRKHDLHVDKMLFHFNKYIKVEMSVNFLGVIINVIRYSVVSLFLFNRVKYGGMTIGDYSMVLAAAIAFSTGMSTMMKSAADLIRENLSMRDYFDFMDLPDEEGKGVQAPPAKNCEIEFEEVSFTYPGSKVNVIDRFSLKINAGERIALVGVNGAGKTTLIKLLTGLYKPTAGRILFNGLDIADFSRDSWFELFSVVFQDINMFAWSFAENVALSENIDSQRLKKAVEDAGLRERVDELPKGCETNILRVLDENGVELSGGQAQRLALARAIYKDGPILILDEPTSALDPVAESKIYEAFDELMEGKTGIYVSHRLSSTRFCDKIVYMENGRVTEYGSHEELMALDGGYADMFQKQSYYYKEGEGTV